MHVEVLRDVARTYDGSCEHQVETTMTVRLVSAIAAVLGVVLGTSAADAMSCARLSPEEHIEATPIIFFGRVAGSGGSLERDNQNRTVEFEVLRAYKGATGRTISITYMNDHGANSGWGFDRNRPLLVFADGQPAKEGDKASAWVGYCSMIRYHAGTHRHWEYWDLLAPMH
jgi:hypothetical protein